MTCRECIHCYMEVAHGWEFSAPFEAWNITGACDLVRPAKGHVGSMTQLDGPTCKHFQQRPHPARIYPERTDKMVREGVWWTDIELMQKMQRLESEKISVQRSLEAFL